MFAFLALIVGVAAIAVARQSSDDFPEGFAPPSPPSGDETPQPDERIPPVQALSVVMDGLRMKVHNSEFLSIPQALRIAPLPRGIAARGLATIDITHASPALKRPGQEQLFRDEFAEIGWETSFIDRSAGGGGFTL